MSSSSFQKLRPRVAHGRGYTAVAFSQNGSRILTVGDDALLRIVTTESVRNGEEEDEDPVLVDQHNGAITCMDVQGGHVVTGSEDQSVYLHGLVARNLKKLLIRCTLTIRDVRLRPGRHGPTMAEWAAVASE
ncbi:hypothetical protein HKX48_007856 [Thoreauomyces humboldtii]|nr:hypothetical protein HKX48_007856 [Thoreauomyces humboldtii]